MTGTAKEGWSTRRSVTEGQLQSMTVPQLQTTYYNALKTYEQKQAAYEQVLDKYGRYFDQYTSAKNNPRVKKQTVEEYRKRAENMTAEVLSMEKEMKDAGTYVDTIENYIKKNY